MNMNNIKPRRRIAKDAALAMCAESAMPREALENFAYAAFLGLTQLPESVADSILESGLELADEWLESISEVGA